MRRDAIFTDTASTQFGGEQYSEVAVITPRPVALAPPERFEVPC
jgi:hypothetical protein